MAAMAAAAKKVKKVKASNIGSGRRFGRFGLEPTQRALPSQTHMGAMLQLFPGQVKREPLFISRVNHSLSGAHHTGRIRGDAELCYSLPHSPPRSPPYPYNPVLRCPDPPWMRSCSSISDRFRSWGWPHPRPRKPYAAKLRPPPAEYRMKDKLSGVETSWQRTLQDDTSSKRG